VRVLEAATDYIKHQITKCSCHQQHPIVFYCMPKKAKPFVLDIDKVKADHQKGKFPYKLCGNTSMEIFNTRIKSYGSIDKLYANYVCTDCRKNKQIAPIKENSTPAIVSQANNNNPIPIESLGRMPDGSINYWFRHPLYRLPAVQRKMVETYDGYVTFVKTGVEDDN